MFVYLKKQFRDHQKNRQADKKIPKQLRFATWIFNHVATP